MGKHEYFYFGTVKNLIAAFGMLFMDVEYVNDWGQVIKVPIHYSPREKFIEITEVSEDSDDGYETMVTLPRFGFELTSIDFDSGRMLNPMSRMQDIDKKYHHYMYNRIPYNFMFAMYLGVRKFEDGLKIIEQIVPFFTPELNITIRDKEDFGYATDVPIVLNDFNFQIDYQGSFETSRVIIWQFTFTAKAFLYSNVREQERVKETITMMTNSDFDHVYATLMQTVNPREADRTQSHTIDEILLGGPPPASFTFNIETGEMSEVVEMDDEGSVTLFNIHPIVSGQHARVAPTLGSL
jgi:hypothetical protein